MSPQERDTKVMMSGMWSGKQDAPSFGHNHLEHPREMGREIGRNAAYKEEDETKL
jgi:hypothetical protein